MNTCIFPLRYGYWILIGLIFVVLWPCRLQAWDGHDRLGRSVRGVTLGPIENARHRSGGYGSSASAKAVHELREMGANWVSLTPFARVWNLQSTGLDLSFEADFQSNQQAVCRMVKSAHAEELSVMLVPHLWVETGEWRALIEPTSDKFWEQWFRNYRNFVWQWARLSEACQVDLLSVGVELRSMATSKQVFRLRQLLLELRQTFPTLALTYSANWDDAADTLLWDLVDVIAINAFYPLANHESATLEEQYQSAQRIFLDLERLAQRWNRPLIFAELGYTNRRDPALRPWEWPDSMKNVALDPLGQATSYKALLRAISETEWFRGYFVWRFYSNPDDVSQEAEWGFSPRGKLAGLVLRDSFQSRWLSDDWFLRGPPLGWGRAWNEGLFSWELSE